MPVISNRADAAMRALGLAITVEDAVKVDPAKTPNVGKSTAVEIVNWVIAQQPDHRIGTLVREINNGAKPVDLIRSGVNEAMTRLAQAYVSAHQPVTPRPPTKRSQMKARIQKLIAEGATDAEIGRQIGIMEFAVKHFRSKRRSD